MAFRCFHCSSFMTPSKGECRRCGARYIAPKAKPENDGSPSSWGYMGAHARARKLTPERRSEIARLASQARWRKAHNDVAE